MSNSAKRGAAKPPAGQARPGQAGPEPAAIPAEGAAETGDATAIAAVPAAEDDAKPDLDDVKRKFREALDHKRQSRAEGQGRGGRDVGKVNGAHGPAGSRRSFRRRSG